MFDTATIPVTDDAMRPAAPGVRACYYCQEPIGAFHNKGCILAAEWIPVLVDILDIVTGERRVHEMDETPFYPGFEYRWRDGNQSCDCNRARYFSGTVAECGKGRYFVTIRRKDTGEILYGKVSFPS